MDARTDLDAPAATSSCPHRQQAVIGRLERRIAQLEDKAKPGGPSGMPGLKPRSSPKSPAPQQSRKPRPHGFSPSTDGPHPPGGARGGELPRLRDPVVRRLDPSHPGGHRPAPGPRASHRARLHRPGLSPLPAQLPPPGGAGRGSLGEAAPGGQPGQPDRHPAGGGEAAHPQHPMVSAHRPPVAPQRGRHRRSHPSHGATGPARVSGIVERIRGSPVVHGETGWREDGANGYVWTFSTPTDRYPRRGRQVAGG